MGLGWKLLPALMLGYTVGSYSWGVTLSSPAFVDGGTLPEVYTSKGSEVSPPMSWNDAPSRTQTYALVVDEPRESGPAIIHWIIYNIPATWDSLPESVLMQEDSKCGPSAGLNSWASDHWVGDLAPSASLRFRLFALKRFLNFDHAPDLEELMSAMSGMVLEVDEITALARF